MANYRDDRDALRDKADDLSKELVGARAALGEKEAELARQQRELERLRKLAGERPPPPPRKRSAVVASLAFSVIALAVVGAFTLTARAPAPRSGIAAAPPIPVVVERSVVPQVEAPAAESPPTLSSHAVFGAKVKSVVGRADVEVGQSCEIAVDVSNPGRKNRVDELVVTCKGTPLYRLSQMTGSITSMTSWSFLPATEGDADHVALQFEDVGARSSDARPQISLASRQRAARVFTEGAIPTEVVLTMDPIAKRILTEM